MNNIDFYYRMYSFRFKTLIFLDRNKPCFRKRIYDMNASRSKFEIFNHEIAEKTGEVLRRNNECDCARTEDVNARLVNGARPK